MATYKTPGVYIEEISTFPPSVAEVETAIPAFMGFTQKEPAISPPGTPKRITSLPEYEQYFGVAEFESITINNANGVLTVSLDPLKTSRSIMHYAMKLYFDNGGGACYIASTGTYDKNPKGKAPGASIDLYKAALDMIAKEDEPTLLVFPDAHVSLSDDLYYSLMNLAIAQCIKLGDRFAIVDVLVKDTIDTRISTALFRSKITASKYAASYFPYLNTDIGYSYDEKQFTPVDPVDLDNLKKEEQDLKKKVTDAKRALDKAADPEKPAAQKVFDEADRLHKDAESRLDIAEKAKPKQTLNSLEREELKRKISEMGVQLSPCAAVAGVYASTDKTRGVWKAPANVSLIRVSSTNVKITDDDQNDMNIDVNDGKSINAIRPFTGKGTKIWGARTLAGNDNEWRYINVRRFFNMVEESVKKSTYWAVFEANDINTWVKVRAMIENYLILKWKDGALAGAKPDDAFFVRVGLGQTMTAQDILEGRMIIEIGMAAVRPAEFIILKFSHKVQVS